MMKKTQRGNYVGYITQNLFAEKKTLLFRKNKVLQLAYT